jgi:hypothetical protein
LFCAEGVCEIFERPCQRHVRIKSEAGCCLPGGWPKRSSGAGARILGRNVNERALHAHVRGALGTSGKARARETLREIAGRRRGVKIAHGAEDDLWRGGGHDGRAAGRRQPRG